MVGNIFFWYHDALKIYGAPKLCTVMYCYVLKLLFLTPQSYSPNLAATSILRSPCLVKLTFNYYVHFNYFDGKSSTYQHFCNLYFLPNTRIFLLPSGIFEKRASLFFLPSENCNDAFESLPLALLIWTWFLTFCGWTWFFFPFGESSLKRWKILNLNKMFNIFIPANRCN